MSQQDKKNIPVMVIYGCAVILFVLVSIHCMNVYETYFVNGEMVKDKTILNAILEGIEDAETNGLLHIHICPEIYQDLFLESIFIVVVTLQLFFNKKKTMFGKEHGTARWATQKEKVKYKDAEDDRNMILTNDVMLSMNTRKTRKNNNIMVVGGSGAGKTRFFAKPNILQAYCSYIICDPKGELIESCGKMLEEEGYIVRCFNLIEMDKSDCYNPFMYIHKESDILKVIKIFISSTNNDDISKEKSASGDPFWDKAETAILNALFFYLWLCCPKEEQNFDSVLKLVDMSGASEKDEDKKSDLDILFEKLEDSMGYDFIACQQYRIFKKAGAKTAKSILITMAVRLNPFTIKALNTLTLTDSLHLDTIGNRKTALFIVIPDSDSTYNFMVSMMYTQAFDEMYFQADFADVEWEDDKVLYRSFDSLASKKNRLKELYGEMKRTVGIKQKDKLFGDVKALMNDIYQECGCVLPPEVKKGKADSLTRKVFNRYLARLENAMIRINYRKRTLNTYINDYTKYKRILRKYAGQKDSREYKKVSKTLKKLEHNIQYEFGIQKKKTEGIQKLLMGQKKKDFEKKADKDFLTSMKQLSVEMHKGSFGSRRSFGDKTDRIAALQDFIKKKEEAIKGAAYFQWDYKKKLRQEIKKAKKNIHSIEQMARYEFGIADLNKRMSNGGRLPVPVRCIMDEFANIAPPPGFDKLIATMRSREISVSIIIQNLAQLKTMFKDSWESITGNCDSYLFLGGQEQTTLEYNSKKLGKDTIDKRTYGASKGRSGSSSYNWDTLGRNLMEPDEIGVMDDQHCLLYIRGMHPCYCEKFKLEKHKRYSRMGETDDRSDSRLFDLASHFNTFKTAFAKKGKEDLHSKELKNLLQQKIDKTIKKMTSISGGNVKNVTFKDFEEGNIHAAEDVIRYGTPQERYEKFQRQVQNCSNEVLKQLKQESSVRNVTWEELELLWESEATSVDEEKVVHGEQLSKPEPDAEENVTDADVVRGEQDSPEQQELEKEEERKGEMPSWAVMMKKRQPVADKQPETAQDKPVKDMKKPEEKYIVDSEILDTGEEGDTLTDENADLGGLDDVLAGYL